MNKTERIAVVRAMETIARQINNENIFETWLTYGVADGDIDESTTDEELECYIEDDENFAELMGTFTRVIARANKSGGLYCDKVTSK